MHRYFDQFNTNGQIQQDMQDIIDWIFDSMVGQIDNAISRSSETEKGLATYLSETGFLPRYGMPSDSRNFYHGFDAEHRKVRSIDRSSEVAMSEFAPGSEKTKDKGKYRVEGLTIPIKEEANHLGNICFYDENGDALADRYILSYAKNIGENDNNISDIKDAPAGTPADQIQQLPDNQRLIVIPQAYRSLNIRNNTGTSVENNDKGSSFTQSQIFARDNGSAPGVTNHKTVGNAEISIYELGLNEDPTVWHVNSNNNKFYIGGYHAQGLGQPSGGQDSQANFMFYENANGGIRPKQSGGNNMEIALGSKKVT